MQIFKYLLIFSLLSLFACDPRPDYPNVPEIEFRSLERYTFFQNATQSEADSIIININFKDGNGDLGLSDQERSALYEPFEYVTDKNNNFILIGSSDSLPEYNQCSYVIDELVPGHSGIDTVLVRFNENTNNYFCELWLKNQAGKFEKFSEEETCQSIFNGRYPILKPEGYEGPLDGILTFTITEPSLRFFIREGQVGKFKVYIKDRALNKSNTIETNEFVFTYQK